MDLAIISLFRNNVSDVARILSETDVCDHILRICVEGDSADGTWEELSQIRHDNIIVKKFDQGNVHYGSTINEDRLASLSRAWNVGLEIFLQTDMQYALICDSDISLKHSDLVTLLRERVDVIAPMLLFDRSVYFRDTWGYKSLEGREFTNAPPYVKQFDWFNPFEVSSVGLPLFHRSVIEDGARFDKDEVVGFCATLRRMGHRIYVTPNARFFHPRLIEVPKQYDREWRIPDHLVEARNCLRLRDQKRSRAR